MYSDKENVNILSSLLPQAGVKDVVVCPGSRNGVLVHNFERMVADGSGEDFHIYPVTDERSAAFVAVGICLARQCRPVAVCVTSGSALLGTLPAVAEAYYRHLPLLVISADRPARWVGQLDGQTLPQVGALSPYCRTFDLPEPHNADEGLWCRDVACEALTSLRAGGGRPVHINVPITEPLFSFSTPSLPACKMVESIWPSPVRPFPAALVRRICGARLPVLLIGQCAATLPELSEIESKNALLVLPEIVSNQSGSWRTALLEEQPALLEELQPDLVIHVGGNLVNKQLKLFLRKSEDCAVIRLEPGDGMPDTFARLETIVHCDLKDVLPQLVAELTPNESVKAAKRRLLDARALSEPAGDVQTELMRLLAGYMAHNGVNLSALHLGNSTVVRSATKCFDGGTFPIHCNRGVNGIEGSLSVAVGHALASDGINLLLIGDLSFFYDQNALWNKSLDGNLRILLFNNGGGRIFDRLPGVSASPAHHDYIAGFHHTSARGIAESYGLRYIPATTVTEAAAKFDELLTPGGERPVLLEFFVP